MLGRNWASRSARSVVLFWRASEASGFRGYRNRASARPGVVLATIYNGLVKVLQARLEGHRCSRTTGHAIRGPHDGFYGNQSQDLRRRPPVSNLRLHPRLRDPWEPAGYSRRRGFRLTARGIALLTLVLANAAIEPAKTICTAEPFGPYWPERAVGQLLTGRDARPQAVGA